MTEKKGHKAARKQKKTKRCFEAQIGHKATGEKRTLKKKGTKRCFEAQRGHKATRKKMDKKMS